MQKQHFTTRVSRLVNPPLLSQMKHLHLNCMENVYASSKVHLGRGKPPNIPKEAKDRCFGKLLEYGDPAYALMYPSDCRMLSSLYDKDFLHPESYICGDISAAGVGNNYIAYHGNSSEQVRDILNEELNDNSCCNIKKKRETEYLISFHPHPIEKSFVQNSLNQTLKNFFNMDDELYKKFFHFAKYQLENCQTISVPDFQEIILNFGFCISVMKLESFLSEFNLIVNNEVDVQKLRDALNWKTPFLESSEHKISRYLKIKHRLFGEDYSFSSGIEAYKDSNQDPQKPAGLPPSIHTPCIIQPSVFERYGIYEEDMNKPRCKDEIISILFESGMCFENEMFDLIWDKLSQGGKASIGDIWKAMKHLYLS